MRRLLLAASEDAAEAQLGDGVERGQGLARHVEGAVEGQRPLPALRDRHQGRDRRHIHVAVDVLGVLDFSTGLLWQLGTTCSTKIPAENPV